MRLSPIWAMKVLCIAEKPAIAKSIASALGGGASRARKAGKYIFNHTFAFNFPLWGPCDVVVTAVAGHLKEHDFVRQYKDWKGCQPIELFEAPIVSSIGTGKKEIADNIQKESRNADILFIWTDCDREGEHIGWEIVEVARSANPRLQGEKIKRASFNNVDPGHLRNAALHPVNLDMFQAHAVQARIELDLRTGAAFTRFQTQLLQTIMATEGVVSYGSCQFPTLGFVVERYRKVRNFVPEPFWYIDLNVKVNDQPVGFTWSRGHLFDRMAVVVLYERCIDGSSTGLIKSVNEKPTSKWRPLPLTTVELQKQGARYLGLSSKKIMDIAEALYTSGYMSYPRTETDQFDSAIDLKGLVGKQVDNTQWGQYAKSLLEDNKYSTPRKGKHNDKAHPPIHPVKGAAANALNNEQKKVYEFVTRHFLACCSEDAKGKMTTVTLDWYGETFTTSGLVVLEKNFLNVYPYIVWDTHQLPEFQQGQRVPIFEAKVKDGKTSPPNYLTEPDLISLMDINGIGTDATMADHIEKILARNYITKHPPHGQKPHLIPTALGVALIEGYDQIGFDMSLTKPFLRKEMEELMTSICRGTVSKNEMIQQSIEKYRNAFSLASQQRNVLVAEVRKYINV